MKYEDIRINEADVNNFVANIQIEADGEKSLADKLLPYIGVSREFMQNEVVNKNAELNGFGEKIIAILIRATLAHAWRQAIPALDIVITPNGFGIVKTNSVVPASKERVEALVRQADEQIVIAVDALYKYVMDNFGNDIFDIVANKYNIFTTIEKEPLKLIEKYTPTASVNWKNYRIAQIRCCNAERAAERLYFGNKLMWTLRNRIEYEEEGDAYALAKKDIVDVVLKLNENDNREADRMARTVITNILTNKYDSQAKQLWLEDPVANLWTHDESIKPYFVNKKNSGGFYL